MKSRVICLMLACALVLVPGCTDIRNKVKIGSQDFTEQKILAEMMALLAEHHSIRVERVIPYGSNRKSLQAIQRGVIDAYPEYSGTLLALSRQQAPADTESAHASVRAVVEPLGLRWLEPFGFENGFTLAVRRDRAIRAGLSKISDLTGISRRLRVATDEGYLARPVDGLYALARRYGLEIGDVETFPVHDRDQIYDALADQKVDVAQVFDTDARLADYGIAVLEDDLKFFPPYQPAPLVREETLRMFPQLQEVWGELAMRIDTPTMRRLNRRVERAGEDYRDVARVYLEELGLLPAQEGEQMESHGVSLAVTALMDQGYLPIRAAEAIRSVMPARRLIVRKLPNPAEAVREGETRFCLAGAEDFYRFDEEGELELISDIEAVGVVGNRLAHVIALEDGPPSGEWRRIGVGPEGGSSWKLAQFVINALALSRELELVSVASLEQRRAMLDAGDIDAVAVMVEPGHAGLIQLLQTGDYRLADLAAFHRGSPALRYTFLRPAKIPAGTYPGQEQALDTVSAQVVLAARLPAETNPIGESGPAYVPGVFSRLPQRLSFDTARRLAAALGTAEAVDPALPASPGLAPETPPARSRIAFWPASVLLNAFAIGFLVFMVVLFFRKLPSEPALTRGDPPP
ncbi:MAG: glycine betaine ABC transporter substrate-binding protein [Halioglobus sp.]